MKQRLKSWFVMLHADAKDKRHHANKDMHMQPVAKHIRSKRSTKERLNEYVKEGDTLISF